MLSCEYKGDNRSKNSGACSKIRSSGDMLPDFLKILIRALNRLNCTLL